MVLLLQVGEVTRVVTTQKVYNLGTSRSNKAFCLNSNPGRPLRLEYISNQPITEEEYTYFRKFLYDHNVGAPAPPDHKIILIICACGPSGRKETNVYYSLAPTVRRSPVPDSAPRREEGEGAARSGRPPAHRGRRQLRKFRPLSFSATR